MLVLGLRLVDSGVSAGCGVSGEWCECCALGLGHGFLTFFVPCIPLTVW